MGDEAINDLEEAEKFLSECREYSRRIEDAVVFLRNSRDRVGDTWRDHDFETISGMIEDNTREAAKAQQIADEEMIPHVAKKVEILKGK